MDYEKIVKQMIADEAISKDVAAKYFPELAESEDERIRKEIIYFLSRNTFQFGEDIDKYKSWIAWLEKQGEHAKFRDSIQVGDKVTRNQDGVLVNLSQLNRVAKKDEKQGDDKVEPKFKVGDVIRLKGSAAEYTIKKVTDTTYYTNGWSCGIERCEEDYELVEQKLAEWSEEDENINECIQWTLIDKQVKEKEPNKYNREIDWLKSLKGRYAWKPSEEQMEVLLGVKTIMAMPHRNYSQGEIKAIESLYEQLKAL